MRYIIIGAGGIGGAIGGYLAAGGLDVALIARGAHLAAIRAGGLVFKSVSRGELRLENIEAYAPTDDFAPGDVVLVCVKGYSLLETVPLIDKCARQGAVVIPILNSLFAGQQLQQALPDLTVPDGCIYTSSFISAPGEITQPFPLFRIVFGPRAGQAVDMPHLEQIAAELRGCGIEVVFSSYIERDMFRKLAFVSAFAATDSFFDVSAAEIHQPGEPREMYIGLLAEMASLAEAMGLRFDNDLAADCLKQMDKTGGVVTSSMHKDLAAGKAMEKQELIFDMVELGQKLGVPVPVYLKAARHFGYEQ